LYLKNKKTATPANTELEQELNKLDFDESMIRGEHYYQDYLKAVSAQQQALQALLEAGENLGSLIRSLINYPSIHRDNHPDLMEAKELVAGLSESTKQYRLDYEAPALMIEKWEREMLASNELRNQLTQFEAEFEESASAFSAINELLKVDWDGTEAEYDALRNAFQGNYEFNIADGGEFEPTQSLKGSGKKQASQAMSMLTS